MLNFTIGLILGAIFGYGVWAILGANGKGQSGRMTDKKLTDEEIIKALECCISTTNDEACVGCPFNKQKLCDKDQWALERYALDLINRQKETIETLRKCVEQHHIIRKDSKSPLSLLTEEIRAEAYKEFAERLKETSVLRAGCVPWYDIHAAIDYLLKEMVGEE